jgi:DNA-binding XRE family transcriptional regulator
MALPVRLRGINLTHSPGRTLRPGLTYPEKTMKSEDQTASLGQRLRVHRLAAGLTVQQLATAAGTSRQHVRYIETGERPDPAWSIVCRMADALGVPIQQLRS